MLPSYFYQILVWISNLDCQASPKNFLVMGTWVQGWKQVPIGQEIFLFQIINFQEIVIICINFQMGSLFLSTCFA